MDEAGGGECGPNLEEFTGLRSLFLEGNCLESLEGLEECTELRCLFVQHNLLLNEIDDIEHLQDSASSLADAAEA